MGTAEVELSSLDLRYESYRMRNPSLEGRLFTSILERGFEEPVEGVDQGKSRILLNGFKRIRCARKLGVSMVPYTSLAGDEVTGILSMLRTSNHKSLSILEQSAFIDDLHHSHKLSVSDIAETLSRSKSWVSMRLGLIGEMTERVRKEIFRGAFPVYPYMYTLRQFMRMNEVHEQDVEDFVAAVSGKKLSVREIDYLAHGYFKGPDWLRDQIRQGELGLVLDRMRNVPANPDGCSEFERVVLRDLEVVGKYMQRLIGKSQDPRLKTPPFLAQANLLSGGVLSRIAAFRHAMETLHDRTANASGDLLAPHQGDGAARDLSPSGSQPQYRSSCDQAGR